MNKSLRLRCGHYALGVAALLFIAWAKASAKDTNLPPLEPFVRYVALAVLTHLGAAFYFLTREIERVREALPASAWVLFAFASLSVLWVFPIFSGDLMEYLIRGRIWAIYHANPYRSFPAEHPNDLLYPFSVWKNYPDAYGPAHLVIKAIPAFLFQKSVTGMIFGMKLINLGFLALGTFFFHKIAKEAGHTQPDHAACLFALCPLTVLTVAVDGQNDILMVSWLILAVYFAIKDRPLLGHLFWLLAFLTKYTAVLALPMLFLYSFKRESRKNGTPPVFFTFKIILILGALGLLAFLPFWSGRQTFGTLSSLQTRFYTNTIPYVFAVALDRIGWTVAEDGVRLAFLGSFLAVYTGLWLRLALRPLVSPDALFKSLAVAYLAFYASLSSPFLYNYLLWALPWMVLSRWPMDAELVLIYSFAGVFSFYKRINFLMLAAAVFYLALIAVRKMKAGRT